MAAWLENPPHTIVSIWSVRRRCSRPESLNAYDENQIWDNSPCNVCTYIISSTRQINDDFSSFIFVFAINNRIAVL